MTITPLRYPKAATTPPIAPKAPQPAAASARAVKVAADRRLHTNPLFVDGTSYDEFQVSSANADFAKKRFGLDQAFVDLVKADNGNSRFAVVYHSDDQGVHLAAYRAAASAGNAAIFAVYNAAEPDFDPGQVYKNELSTPLGGGKFFGTVVASKRLAVPGSATAATRRYLADNGFEQKETLPVSRLQSSRQFKDYFGLSDQMNLQMFALQKRSFGEKFKVFYSLFKESPEYRAFKLGDVFNEVGSAMVLGVITPKMWEQGTAYGIASTISSIGNIGFPAIGIVGESILGSLVDNAVNSDRPLDSLKKLSLANGGLHAVRAGANFAMHPAVVKAISSHPGTAFIGLYSASTVLGSISGVISGKADIAIHDQLINKAVLKDTNYAKNFYTILGVEMSISRALYLGAYSGTAAAVSAFPGSTLIIAGVGAAVWAASNFVWPLYHEKPEVKTTIAGTDFIHQGDRYVFDSGWEIAFKGGKGRIVRDDPDHFSVAVDDGDLYMKNDLSHPVELTHKRRLKDYLPKFLKPKVFGEKERWDLANGDQKISVSRYGNAGYHVNKVSDSEYLVTRSDKPDQFW